MDRVVSEIETVIDSAAGDIPRDFQSLRTLIAARRPKLPKRLVQAADFIVENPQAIAFGRVAELATQAGVQPSTLVRFSQALGYSGFSDLQAVFRAHARQRWPDYRERLEALGDADAEAADGSPARLQAFIHAGQVSLDHLGQTVDPAVLDAVLDRLAGARSVSIVGMRRVYPVALYLCYGLRKLGLRCDMVDNAGGLGHRQMELLGTGDVVLAISFTPYAGETLELCETAVRSGAEVLALTDSAFSPLAQIAGLWLEVVETDHGGFRSLTASMTLAITIMVALAERRRLPDPA